VQGVTEAVDLAYLAVTFFRWSGNADPACSGFAPVVMSSGTAGDGTRWGIDGVTWGRVCCGCGDQSGG